MNKLLKWRLVVLAIFTTLLGGTFIFKPDADKIGGLVANVKLADIEKPLITKPDKPAVKKKPVVKKTPKRKVVKPKAIKPRLDPRIVFTENFSKYSVGDPIPSWGPNLQVLGSRMKYVDSQIAGKHTAGQYISFPNNFSLQFTILNNRENTARGNIHELPVFLIDSKGDILKIDFKLWDYVFGYKLTVNFPETQPAEYKISPKQNALFRLTYNTGTAKVYINGKFVASHYYGNKFGRFKEFQVTIMGREIRYTNFLIKDLSDSPSVRTASVGSNASTPYSSKPATQTLQEQATIQAERVYAARFKITLLGGQRFTCRCIDCTQRGGAKGKTFDLDRADWGMFLSSHNLRYEDTVFANWFKSTYGIFPKYRVPGMDASLFLN